MATATKKKKPITKLGSARKKGSTFKGAITAAGTKSKNIEDRRKRKSAFHKKDQPPLAHDISEIIEDGVGMSLRDKMVMGYTKKGLMPPKKKPTAGERIKKERMRMKPVIKKKMSNSSMRKDGQYRGPK